MRALAQLNDSRVQGDRPTTLPRDAQAAVAALKTMGPAAESTVIGLVDHQDPVLRQAMCGVLEEIGTGAAFPVAQARAIAFRLSKRQAQGRWRL